MEGPHREARPRRELLNLTFSANLVPNDSACMAGTAPIPAARSAASTADREAPHDSRAQTRLLALERMRRLVDSDIPKPLLTRAFDDPDAHAARTASANPSE